MSLRLSLFLFLSFFLIASCDDTEDTIVNIKVIDVDAAPIPGAEVTLFSQPEDSEIEEIQISNAAGEAIFDLSSYFSEGQFGLFVLNIEVVADTLEKTSIIQVVPEEVNKLTLTLE